MKKILLIFAFIISIVVLSSCKTVQDCPAYGNVELEEEIKV